MEVRVSPIGRQPYLAPLRAAPQFGTLELGGYSTATIVQGRVSRDKADRMLYAPVEIWGRQGPCWYGVVADYDRDGTMHCVGPMQVLGWHAAPALGPHASISWWQPIMYSSTYVPTWLGNVSTFVNTNSLVLSSAISMPVQSVAQSIAELVKYDSWIYGWYHEFISGNFACVPHYAAASTTPDYIITLSAEDAASFMGESLDSMARTVVTTWGPDNTVESTVDATAGHYLVDIGRDKVAFISSPNTQSAADAALIAATAIERKAKKEAGLTAAKKTAALKPGTASARLALNSVVKATFAANSATAASNARQLQTVRFNAPGAFAGRRTGTGTTSRIQLASGLDAYFPAIRSGTLARVVGLPSGPVDLRIAATTCDGESSISVDLGTDTGRAEALFARVG